MKLSAAAAAILAALLAAPAAHAAGFDCAKASRPIEKRICADPALSAADGRMADLYRRALAASPAPGALRQGQRGWLRRLAEVDRTGEALTEMYAARIRELEGELAVDTRMAAEVPLSRLAAQCLLTFDNGGTCDVEKSGVIKIGPGLGPDLAWQTVKTSEYESGFVILEVVAPGRGRPVLWQRSDAYAFDDPRIVCSPAGPLLHVPGYQSGTGNFNAEALFRRAGTRWVDVDATGWEQDLDRRLPKGLEVWKGLYIDYRTFKVATPLWRTHDGNCCASGGRADATVGLEGGRIVLKTVKVTLGRRAAESF